MKSFIVRFHEIIQVQVQSTFDDPMAMPSSGPAGLLQEVPAPADFDLNVPFFFACSPRLRTPCPYGKGQQPVPTLRVKQKACY